MTVYSDEGSRFRVASHAESRDFMIVPDRPWSVACRKPALKGLFSWLTKQCIDSGPFGLVEVCDGHRGPGPSQELGHL